MICNEKNYIVNVVKLSKMILFEIKLKNYNTFKENI